MTQLIPAVLSLLLQIAPGATTEIIAKIIQILAQLAPLVIQYAKDEWPSVKLAFDALRANPAAIPAQLDDLDAVEAKADADFEAAAAAAQAEDDAAS